MDDLQYMFPSYTEDHDHYILKIIIVLKCVCVDIYIYTLKNGHHCDITITMVDVG